MKSTIGSPWGRWAALVVVVVMLPGSDCFFAKTGAPRDTVKSSLRRVGNRRYAAATARSSEPKSGVKVIRRELWPPLRVEATVGPMDPKRRGDLGGALWGIELDGLGGFPPATFYGISVQELPGGAGMNAFSASHVSKPGFHEEADFQGATLMQLAIEHDGQAVHFFARPEGATDWTGLGEVSAIGHPLPLLPTAGVFQLRKPSQIGFDDFRVIVNGDPPAPRSALEQVIEDVFRAMDGQVEVVHRLDGDDVTTEGAASKLEEASTSLDGIIGILVSFDTPGGKRKKTEFQRASGKLATARKQLTKAIRDIGKNKKPKRIGKKIEKAIKLCGDAEEILLAQ